MAVFDKGVSWQININRGRHEKRFIKNFLKAKYSYEEVVEIEINVRRDLGKPSLPSRLTITDVALPYIEHISATSPSQVTVREKKRCFLGISFPFLDQCPPI